MNEILIIIIIIVIIIIIIIETESESGLRCSVQSDTRWFHHRDRELLQVSPPAAPSALLNSQNSFCHVGSCRAAATPQHVDAQRHSLPLCVCVCVGAAGKH